ncbi:MAG: winged helix-turn-helix domain-containing protein, partial [Kangiellaceae bacterium]|nr:winged helix-turn-helix domain-containing protein [Kangiellaceae bacterium]
MIYSFQQFQLDTLQKKLYLNTELVTDDLKVVNLIELLCRSYPEMTDKSHLMDELWPGQVVSEASLSRLISDTRALLDDSGKEQELIKTIRGKGFRLNTKVITRENLTFQEESSTSQEKKGSKQKYYTKFIFASIIVLSGISGWLWFYIDNPTNSPKNGIRIAVLPVESLTLEPVDDWIRFGIMSMATEQLGRYSAIQSIPVNKIISLIGSKVLQDNSLQNLSKDNLLRGLFSDYCRQLGCTHLVVINFSLQDNQTALSYQFITHDEVSILKEFVENDVMEAADLMLDHLASDLIPQKRQRLSILTSYSTNNKANRDYATGVHELYDGNYSAAEEYLELALNKEPEFFWAKAYLAEAKYRQGNFKDASKIIQTLENIVSQDNAFESKRTYFIGNLKSNVLYSQGKLQESLDLSLNLMELS